MREVAKSVLGLSWAVSVFGYQQLTRAMAPTTSQPLDLTALEADELSRVVQSRLTADAVQQFRAGDDWQRRLVDLVFDVASLRPPDPRRLLDVLDPRALLDAADPRAIVETGVTAIQRGLDTAVDTVRQTADRAVDVATGSTASRTV